MDDVSGFAKFMRFVPLFSTILMLIFWIYNYYNPTSA